MGIVLQDGKKPSDPLQPGTEVLGGRYVVERVLGQGGMGVVVAARHKALGRRDAIKFLLPELGTNHEMVRRFEREAKVVARLESPHVAKVYDSQFAATNEPYIVMEYLEGQDLKSVLRNGPLPVEQAVDYLLQVCHALAEAHENGVVHRDLKPANLFLTFPKHGGARIKVLDFGIAKELNAGPVSDQTAEDGSAGFLGTIPYMSPEHLRGAGKVDVRTDIWALGVIAYELLTGKRPFQGATKFDLVSKITNTTEHPEPPSSLRQGLPAAIEMVIGRCLAKERDARYASVQEFEMALRQATGLVLPSPMRAPLPSITLPSVVDVLPTTERTHGPTQQGLASTNSVPTSKPGRRTMAFASAAALVSVAVVGSIGWRASGQGSSGNAGQTPAGSVTVVASGMTSVTAPITTPTASVAGENAVAPVPAKSSSAGKPVGSAASSSLPPPVASSASVKSTPGKPSNRSQTKTSTDSSTAIDLFGRGE